MPLHIYTCFLVFAVYLNRDSLNSVLLTLLVGLSWYLPVDMIHSKCLWFSVCIMSEVLVLISAIALNTSAKYALVGITTMLALSHALCWEFKSLGTYYIVENYLEYIELLSCLLFSQPIIHKIKEVVKCQVQKY